jgi:hypothetical protein
MNQLIHDITHRFPTMMRCVMRRGFGAALLLVSAWWTAGCAVHWYDEKTGTDHLWGFGHLRMRAVPQPETTTGMGEGPIAFVTGKRSVGAQLGLWQEDFFVGAGLDSRSRIIIPQEGAEFALEWPANALWLPRDLRDLFTLDLRRRPAWATNSAPTSTQGAPPCEPD